MSPQRLEQLATAPRGLVEQRATTPQKVVGQLAAAQEQLPSQHQELHLGQTPSVLVPAQAVAEDVEMQFGCQSLTLRHPQGYQQQDLAELPQHLRDHQALARSAAGVVLHSQLVQYFARKDFQEILWRVRRPFRRMSLEVSTDLVPVQDWLQQPRVEDLPDLQPLAWNRPGLRGHLRQSILPKVYRTQRLQMECFQRLRQAEVELN